MMRAGMRVSGLLSLGAALLSASCSSPVVGQADDRPFDLERLQIEAHVDTGSWGARGVTVIRNRSGREIRFGIASMYCAVALVLYSDLAVKWDQSRIWRSRAGGCKWIPRDVELLDGASLTVRSDAATMDAILGDSLPEGRYAARVRVIFARFVPHPEIVGALTTQIDTVVSVPAGSIDVHR